MALFGLYNIYRWEEPSGTLFPVLLASGMVSYLTGNWYSHIRSYRQRGSKRS